MAFLSWIQQPKSLTKSIRESIDHHLRMTTQMRQLLQETRNMRPVNQGVVSLTICEYFRKPHYNAQRRGGLVY